MSPTRTLEPILCAPLLRQVDAKLVELLHSLSPAEWEAQTVAPQWKVRDVAAHLLDTQLRKLSMVRDGFFAETPEIRSPQDLADFVNRLNREGVAVYRRLSAPVLVGLLEVSSRQSADFHEALDPFAPAVFAVSWAGENKSLNWFDTARELTERWHHQQQIRLAVNRPGILTPELYHPVLDCFLRGLPHHYRGVAAEPGTLVRVEVSGECGGVWWLERGAEAWGLVREASGPAAAGVTIPEQIAWRIFTRGIGAEEAARRVGLEGDAELGQHLLTLVAVVG